MIQEPPTLEYEPLSDEELAARAGVSLDAVQLLRSSEVIDLHLETFIPPRLVGYDLHRRHDRPFLRGRFFGHLDFPRALDGGLTGAMWSIATNIARGSRGRLRAIEENAESLRRSIEATSRMRVVRSHAEYEAARQEGLHGALICVQGGNAFEDSDSGVDVVPASLITRVTLVHLSSSCFGTTSSPLALWGRKRGLTDSGRRFIEMLNASRVFLDLAHINPEGFWDAMDVHDKSQPVLVTHTGVDGVRPLWRNIDDAQVRAVAETGGVVGIIFHASFLRRSGGPKDLGMVLEHMQHVIDVAGEDAVAIGSDYDGAITPPPDLRDGGTGYVRLVQGMLDAQWTEERIQKVLGQSFLRAFEAIRPD